MRILGFIALAATLTGCVTKQAQPVASGISAVGGGAGDPKLAVEHFLSGNRTRDFKRVRTMWGNHEGPLADRIPSDEYEQRQSIMSCFLSHEEESIGEMRIAAADERRFAVNLTKRGKEKRTVLTVVRGPSNRWFVQDVDLQGIQEFCTMERTGR